MKWLAIDTSTDLTSVALQCGEELFYQEQKAQRMQAQHLLPMIDEVMSEVGISIKELNAIIFGRGPGSFTGLRIACSVAKGLACAYDLDLIPISSLAAIAWSARKQILVDLPLLALIDARMQELYWAYYPKGEFKALEQVNRASDIILLEDNQPLACAGIGIEEYWFELPQEIKKRIDVQLVVPPNAAAMIELARATAIQPVSVLDARPVYVRNQVTSDKMKKN
jgi:tRNA threonylcarbamoyladenosine biosynthesis protein TsaB